MRKVFGFVKRNLSGAAKEGPRVAGKGVRGKAAGLAPPSTGETRSAISAPAMVATTGLRVCSSCGSRGRQTFPPSIPGWDLFNVIDHQDLNGLLPRLKIQPDLIAQGRHDDSRDVWLFSWFGVCKGGTEIDGEVISGR